MLRRVVQQLRVSLPMKMTSPVSTVDVKASCSTSTSQMVQSTEAVKRSAEDPLEGHTGIEEKRAKQTPEVNPPLQGRTDRKRKVALLLAYNGKGYYGIQRNPGFPSIEDDLVKALVKIEVIPQEHADDYQKMSFQRASRTDKGVSAAGNVVSLKMLLNVENLLEKLNENLPDQIRVFDYVRVTGGFNSKNAVDARTYIYVMPTYAFAPFDQVMDTENYRITGTCRSNPSFDVEEYRVSDEIISQVNTVLSKFVGSHNFHNYTSGLKPTDRSAKRYIISFACGKPFVREGMEFVVLKVKGQSFMLHQIRKMIGMTVPIVNGYCGMDSLERTWLPEKVDVPKVPGLGLLLDQLHYGQYNKRFGSDGVHSPILWEKVQDQIDKFKEEKILSDIYKTEKEEKSFLQWMGVLSNHKLGVDEKMYSSWHVLHAKRVGGWRDREIQKNTEKSSEQAIPSVSTSEDSKVSSSVTNQSASNSSQTNEKSDNVDTDTCSGTSSPVIGSSSDRTESVGEKVN